MHGPAAMVPFILAAYLTAAATAAAELPRSGNSSLAGFKAEMRADNGTVQYLQFDDILYDITDFTICSWIKLTNFSQTQTIFRLTGDKNESVILWRIHTRPKETMRLTIKNKLVASEITRLATSGRWNHVCFQWMGSTSVWAMFVNSKIHSVGQTAAAAGNDTSSSSTAAAAAAWKLRGRGAAIVGDDGAPCRNGWQTYGLYMTGTPTTTPTTTTTTRTPTRTPTRTGTRSADGAAKSAGKRQAVFDSDADDPAAAAPPKPFQWLTKTFAFIKRMFTFVIVPFFKFVRNTFFQTRSTDDTVVDVSETHLTVSEIKFEPVSATATAAATGGNATSLDSAGDDSPSKREASDRQRCDGDGGGGVTAADLLASGAAAGTAVDGALSPNAGRYLRMVTEGLNQAGVNAAIVRRAFACCRGRATPADVVLVDWDRARAAVHNATVSAHACGRP